jgi:RHS repeat-associated protein
MGARRSVKAVHSRWFAKVGFLALVATLTLLTATLSSAPPPVRGHWPLLRLPSRTGLFGSARPGRPDWKGVPQQADGSATGRSHDASAAATRAAAAAGHPRGKGAGELPAYTPPGRKITPGLSAPAKKGFDPKTSTRNAAKSTATTTYYDNPDGSHTRKFSLGTVNYRDSQGNWQAIDTNLWSSAGRWRQRANGTDVQFAGTADDPNLVSFDLDSAHGFSYALRGAASVTGQAKGDTLTFPAALPHTDLRMWPTAGGTHEDLILRSADAAASWTFPLNLRGLTAKAGAAGTVALVDDAGTTRVNFPAGYAYDSKFDPKTGESATTRAVTYQLRPDGDHTDLVMNLDAAWLHDPARVFPVTVDPSAGYMPLTTYVETGITADHSSELWTKIGSYDSGPGSAKTLMQFPDMGIDGSHVTVTAAQLDLYVIWANGCPNAERFDVAAVTQPWNPATATTYPGPTLGASIGSLTQATPFACGNTQPDPMEGDPVQVALSTATFQAWANGTSPDYGLGIYASTTDSLHWKYFASMNAGGFAPPDLELTYTGTILPQVVSQAPANGTPVNTLTPLLSAVGTMDYSKTSPVKFDFQVFNSAGVKVADSGLVNGAYTVPAGKLQWGQTYFWAVQASDGTNYSANPAWYQFTAAVPQPAITSTLSGDEGGHGFDPSIGNYANTATDAEVATVGPALSIVRDYNSRDPRRTNAFGAAWSALVDARAAEQYDTTGAVANVVVTYPDGAEVGYGRNADGSFTAPSGRASTLIKLTNGYELIDKADTAYTFAQALGSGAYGITSIADANNRTETFGWVSGQITAMTSVVTGRVLHLTWNTPAGAGGPHVATVATDPLTAGQPATAYTWTYGYTGDQLTSVCPPGTTTACTRYGYDPHPASQQRNDVFDAGATSYWPLAETSGTVARSAVVANEGTDNAKYTNVSLGTTTGPLPGGTVTAATFDGSSSRVDLPATGMSAAIAQSMSLWFKAAPGTPAGVLFSYSSMEITPQTNYSQSMPNIYLGTDGKLLGEFWLAGANHVPNPITTSASVADGNWHHVVLTGSQTAQSMYLDGALVNTIGGWGVNGWDGDSPWLTHHAYLGTGFLGESEWGMGAWPDEPHSDSTQAHYGMYFKGSIADASWFTRALSAKDAADLHNTGLRPDTLLTSITRPSGKTFASVTYDPVSAAVKNVVDENGGTWGLAAPTVAGSSQVYRASVLGAAPAAYYRLGDNAGASQAYTEVGYPAATYGSVTLGVPGRFSDNPAGSFNGTSSFLQLPASTLNGNAPQSIGLWFNTTHANGVLFAYSATALSAGSTTANYVPSLYIGTDGKLKGTFWSLPQITTAAAVTDGKWHYVVLAGATTTQSMYLDGELVGTTTGTMASPQSLGMVNDYIGSGFIGGNWTDNPHNGVSTATPLPFNGTLGEVAYYRSQLTGAQVAGQYGAANNSYGLSPMTTVTVTDPGGHPVVHQYDALNGNRPIAEIDARGNKTSYGYDTSGFLYTTTDPNGAVATTGHDADGNVVSRTTCQSQATNVCSTAYSTYKPNTMGQDQAKAATVTASGSANTTTWAPANAADGNTASVSTADGWSSNKFTTAANSPWIQLDMGSARTIDRVDLYPRNDAGNVAKAFPQGFTVAVSANGTTWTTVTTQTNYATPTSPAPATFGFTPTSARYIKVTGSTLRTDGTAGSYYMQFAEVAALNDRPDPTAGELLTSRDPRSASATDNTYLTSYGYDTVGDQTGVTSPPVTGFPSGRTSTVAYTDGTTVAAADSGFAPAGLPYRTTSPGGAVNTIVYFHSGDVASTTDADGLVTRYTYDALGRVASKTVVSDTYPVGLVTTYGYDGRNQVTSEVDPTVTDRVTGVVHTPTVATVFDADGNTSSQTVSDPTGGDAARTQSSTYNAYDQVDTATDALNHVTRYTYDGFGHKLTTTDPNGAITTDTYDNDGNLTTQALTNFTGDPLNPQPAAPLIEESRAYDPAGRLASLTNAMGNTTSYTYTDNGLPVTATRTDASGHNPYVMQQDFYDAGGNLVKEITNNGATTTTTAYDPAARPTSSTLDATGVNRTTTLTYTPDDAVASTTSSDGSGASQTTAATYDPMGRVTSRAVSGTGTTGTVTTSWTLDRRGLATSMTDANTNVTNYSYDEAGHLVLTEAPTVNVETNGGSPTATRPMTLHGYDTFGDEVEVQDPNLNVVVTAYDAAGQVHSQTLPNYTPPGGTTPIVATTTRDYDAVGNLIKVTDPLSRATQYLYDQLGDVAQVTDADGGHTHYTYDANGDQLSATDPTGAASTATYDHLGRTLTTSALERYPSPTTATTTNSYAPSVTDPGGAWLATTTSPAGVITTYGYNNVGEQVSVTDGAANTSRTTYDFLGRPNKTIAPDNTSTTVAYNQLDNPITVTDLDPSNAVLSTHSAQYDGAGNLLSTTDGRNHTTTFTYDATGSLTQEVQPVDASTSITTTFGYDAAGNRTRFTDGRNNRWLTTYNVWGLPESVTEPTTASYSSAADRTSTTTYDAAGQQVGQTQPGGVSLSATYDAMGRLHTQSGSGADAATAGRTFGYDLDGRLTSAQTAAAGAATPTAETFTYNDRGGLLSATGTGGASSFGYSPDGLLTSRTDAAGTATYAYDTADRLKTLADATTGVTLTYGYNTQSQVSSIGYGAGGDNRSFGYDYEHRLTSDVLKTAAGTTVASIGYGYDANDNVTSKTTTGFAGAASNTYTYDFADRLLSWNNGATTVDYGYDASGNRTRVGANVYTYDARDQLTSDGTNSYTYTARGTLKTQSSAAGGTVQSTSDAYGQAITQATQTYAYDALGRVVTGNAATFSYSGLDNTIAGDGTSRYSRDPASGLVGIATGSTSVLGYTDQHTDVVGDFTATGSALAGSTAYDPLGNVLTTANQAGSLGFQSGWTDRVTGRVDMAARWYNPAIGQFMNKDTQAQDPVPNPAEANPFAYVDDNPMTGTDPSGHGWFSSLTHKVSSAVHSVSAAVSSGWNSFTANVSYAWNSATTFVSHAATVVRDTYHAVVHKVKDTYHKVVRKAKQYYHKATHYVARQVHKAVHAVKTAYHAVTHAAATAYHATTKAVKTAAKATVSAAKASATFVKNHAGAIASFVVSTAVFMGCEAALGALTAGVGAVAGAVACGALAGAVGGLVTQGAKCLGGEKGACSAGSFIKAGVIGGVVGGVAGLGGALGGKLLSAVGGKALSAVGGLFGRGGADLAEGAVTDVAEGAAADTAASVADGSASSSADSVATSTAEDAGRATPRSGGQPHSEEPNAPRSGRSDDAGDGCHSFTGGTLVLLAGGATKRIDQVKVGDTVNDTAPNASTGETHTVQRVIVTHDDHEFVDLSIAPLSASVAGPRASGTLTTTAHHPFYDRTQAAFVDAADLHVGDVIQTPTGFAVITGVRPYHGNGVTYDLTIDGLHTYFVVAGATPVLVHNCGSQPSGGRACSCTNASQGPGNAYSVAYETRLSPNSYPGLTRGAHFREANQNLLDAMDSDADFDNLMESIIPGLRNRIQGAGGRAADESPSDLGWTWHHHVDPGRMQLVPMGQHSAGGAFRALFHPGGRGGFSIWG